MERIHHVVPDWPNEEYDRIYIFQITGRGRKKGSNV